MYIRAFLTDKWTDGRTELIALDLTEGGWVQHSVYATSKIWSTKFSTTTQDLFGLSEQTHKMLWD